MNKLQIFCVSALVALLNGCNYCDNNDIVDRNIIVDLGTIVTPEGETCRIEQITLIDYNIIGVYTETFKTLDGGECFMYYDVKPLVRRIVCPSGKNGQSVVTDDKTKYHREVLE